VTSRLSYDPVSPRCCQWTRGFILSRAKVTLRKTAK
jgi:hypothetical protein